MSGHVGSGAACDGGLLPAEAHLLCLAGLPRMGPSRLATLTAGRDPAVVWRLICEGRLHLDGARRSGPPGDLAETWRTSASSVDPVEVWRRHRDVQVDGPSGAGFPGRLLEDPERPALLVRRGAPIGAGPTAAIVGTRRCTAYGREVAQRLGAELAEAGVGVVSGLAHGIDGAAHRGALSAGSEPPIGVVATGLDVVYPQSHSRLWDEVAERGTLLSEVPLGTPPTRWRFPARNRLVAGLADVVVVVESHDGGGSLHTVTAALARDVTVMAVPGPVTSPASAGTNALLVDGAAPVRDAADVLTCLDLVRPLAPALAPGGRGRPAAPARGGGGARVETSSLDEAAATLLGDIDVTPTSVDTIALRSGTPPLVLHARLRRLAGSGHVDGDGAWWWRTPATASPYPRRVPDD